jgi:cysteinyl-tRNA synthetase
MSVHYRSPIDFTENNLKQAGESRARIQNLWDRLSDMIVLDDGSNEMREFENEVMMLSKECTDTLKEALSDDLNVSKALAVFHSYVGALNSLVEEHEFTQSMKALVLNKLREFDEVFKLIKYEKDNLNEEQSKLYQARVEARLNKDYQLSDQLRDELFELGVQVMDSKDGTTYRLI